MIVKVGDILVNKVSGREFAVFKVMHNYGLLKESVTILSPILEPGFAGINLFVECDLLDLKYKFKSSLHRIKVI